MSCPAKEFSDNCKRLKMGGGCDHSCHKKVSHRSKYINYCNIPSHRVGCRCGSTLDRSSEPLDGDKH